MKPFDLVEYRLVSGASGMILGISLASGRISLGWLLGRPILRRLVEAAVGPPWPSHVVIAW
jgi:hypothetical protein